MQLSPEINYDKKKITAKVSRQTLQDKQSVLNWLADRYELIRIYATNEFVWHKDGPSIHYSSRTSGINAIMSLKIYTGSVLETHVGTQV